MLNQTVFAERGAFYMKRSFSLSEWLGFGVVSLLGTFFHFLFDLTSGSVLVAPFTAVNESTFEHMKLLYFPLLLFATLQYFFFRGESSFWCVKLRGTLRGLILIPVLFYTLNGCFGKTPDYVNISMFFIAAAATFLYETRKFESGIPCPRPKLSLILLLLIGACFVLFTFYPPKIPLFADPIDGSYGF